MAMATSFVFASVGTTRFDLLIQTLTSPSILQILKKKGYKKLVLQIGNGTFIPKDGLNSGILIEYYRFKNNISDDIRSADLIISHAGAGTIMETLYSKKPLLVVINEELMGNHQMEIAEKLAQESYLYFTNCKNLSNDLNRLDFNNLKPFEKVKNSKFQEFLDNVTGYV